VSEQVLIYYPKAMNFVRIMAHERTKERPPLPLFKKKKEKKRKKKERKKETD
jgi:hypothetical protein